MFKVINFFFKSSWKQISIASLASLIVAGFNVLCLKYLKEILVSDDEKLQYFLLATLLIVSSTSISLIVGNFNTRFFENKLVEFREDLSRKILNSSHDKISSKLNKIAPVLLFEVDQIGNFGKNLPGIVIAFSQTVVIFIYLFFLFWQLAAVVFGIFGLITLLMFFLLPVLKKIEKERSKSRTRLHTMFELMNLGFKNLAVNRNHAKSFVYKTINAPSKQLAIQSTKVHVIAILIEQVLTAVLLIVLGAFLLFYQSWIVVNEEVAIQFMVVLFFILPSFVKMIDFLNQLKKVENALEQINDLNADLQKEFYEETVEGSPKEGEAFIRLEEAEFSYANSSSAFKLGPISLEIKENEIVFIKGGNGSGKTTLFNILAGLCQPTKGKFKFRGNLIDEKQLSSYQSHLSCHFTDTPIFDDLSYIDGDDEKADSYIKELELEGKTNLRFFYIHDFNLSFGQKGRLSLLRVLLEDKPICMLDEWAANQDFHFKEKFYNKIVPEIKAKGKTVILISHDDKYHSIADQVITLRNGQVESVTRENG